MSQNAKIIKALALENRIRVYISNTTDIVNTTIFKHDLWPSAASVLGKTMTIGVMMGAMLKQDEALTIKIDGNGPIGVVVCDANAKGEVRGYVTREHVHFDKNQELDDVTTLGNNGFIDVIKDLKLKDLFTSSIPLQTGDLAKDFTYYFTVSEQTPSMVSLGSLFDVNNQAKIFGGIIIQLLPDALEKDIVYLESKINILSKFSKLLLENENLEDILKLLFNEDYEIIETKDIMFKCDCSKEKFAGGLISLGKEQIQDIIGKEKHAEVVCHYCKNVYDFNENELNNLLKYAKGEEKNGPIQ